MVDVAPSTSKRLKLQNTEYDTSPDWTTVFNLASSQTIYPAFAILQLGSECNAHTSASFTEAKCDFRKITVGEGSSLFVIDFDDVFSKGIDVLSVMENKTRKLNADEDRAVDMLDNYFKEKELHEQSLAKVLGNVKAREENSNDSFETHVTVALAEHLLKKLAPGQSYVMDGRARGKNKEKCTCGLMHCSSKPAFDSTGIGDEKAWHGFPDIIFPSHPVAAIVAKECLDDEDNDSPVEKITGTSLAVENQALAQTIVFSYIQRKRNSTFQNLLNPNILMSPRNIRILMYDSENDILICSVNLPIFQTKDKPEKLCIETVVFLWMVLHYRTFCVGINVEELLDSGSIKDIKEIQASFPERARENFHLYEDSASKIGIAKFQSLQEERLPSYDDLIYGKRLFKPRWLSNTKINIK